MKAYEIELKMTTDVAVIAMQIIHLNSPFLIAWKFPLWTSGSKKSFTANCKLI